MSLKNNMLFRKSDYCALSGPEMFLRRARNGKRIFRVPYSNLAPTLEGFETGLSVHADKRDDFSYVVKKGKGSVHHAWTDSVSNIFASSFVSAS